MLAETKERCNQLNELMMDFNGQEYVGRQPYNNDFNVHHTEITCDTEEQWKEKIEKLNKALQERIKNYIKQSFQFKDWTCRVRFKVYGNDRVAICIYDAEDGCPVETPTVNLPEYDLKDDHVHIKEWSEGKGNTEILEKLGIIEHTGEILPVNQFGNYATVCKLLIPKECLKKS